MCAQIPIEDDGVFENPESFTVVLTTTDPAVILDPDTATVEIIDDGESVCIGISVVLNSEL